MLSSPATRPGVAGTLIAALWFYAALGISLNLIGPALEAIREDFGLAYAELAVALAAVGAGYAAGSIAGGMLSDRIGRRPAILLATVLAGLSIGVAASSGGLTIFVVAWLFAGIGLGGADGAVTALISDVAGERAGPLLNVAHLTFAAGALVAPALVGLMLSNGAGWRPAVWIAAALMLTSLVPFVRLRYQHISAAPVRLREAIGEMAAPIPLLLGVGLALYVGVEIGFGGFFAGVSRGRIRPGAAARDHVGVGVLDWAVCGPGRWRLAGRPLGPLPPGSHRAGADRWVRVSYASGARAGPRPSSEPPRSEHLPARCSPRSSRLAFVCGPGSPGLWPAA